VDECAPQCTRVCVRVDLVGRVITIRSAYKGMHQGGNKSGAHRESICFHLHGRTARAGRAGGGRRRGKEGRWYRWWNAGRDGGGGVFRAERIARSRELFMEWLLKSYGRRGRPYSQNTGSATYPLRGERKTPGARPRAPSPSPSPLAFGPEIRRSRCFSWTE